MERGLTNITSATTTTLIDFDSHRGNISTIQISNNNSSNPVTISLYLHDGTVSNDAYIISDVVIPSGVALLLNESPISFNTDVLALKIVTAGTSPKVSVIIR
jgi:hypothetical protein